MYSVTCKSPNLGIVVEITYNESTKDNGSHKRKKLDISACVVDFYRQVKFFIR